MKAMEVDERPTEQYADIGGLDKQIQEASYTLKMLKFMFIYASLCFVHKYSHHHYSHDYQGKRN